MQTLTVRVLVGLALLLPLVGVQAQTVSPSNVTTTVPNPWLVPGVVVTVTDTAGFARDVALEQAARQALPKVLSVPLGLAAADATRKARTVGEALRFVSRYQIVRESVLPNYTLTVDLQFNEAMLRKNFGGVVSPTQPAGTVPSANPTASPTVVSAIPQEWVVRVAEPTAAGQDRARRALAALPNTTATIRLLAPQGIEFLVQSTVTPAELTAALAGWQPEISAASATLPVVEATPAVPVAPAATPPAARTRPAWLPELW
ncbi:MAG: hypothetical protein INF43_02525 [Alphaproteobacteria bacterium]|jgi:hypothetical protein|nr:hypothetical protein [Alphaproteobacteria bacterium]